MSSTSSTGSTGSNIVSVASSTSSGAAGGSVINVSELVSELVSATQTPQQDLINNQEEADTTQISALGTLKSALSTFQSSLSALDTPSAFNQEAATSSNTTAVTATVGSGAATGSYSVGVTQLASAQQLLSKAFTGDGSTAVGTGTLQLSLGGTSFTVNVASGNDSLDDIASAINSATGNPGITATVIQGTDGAHLLLSSSLSGSTNTITVSETDSGDALSALTYSGTGGTGASNYTQESPAQDAQYSISGVDATSSSNTVSDAIPGVTLTLTGTTTTTTGTGTNATTTDDPATVTVSTDTSTIEGNISTFVSAYNTLVQSFASLGGYDSSTSTAGPMMGNALLSSIESQVNSAIYNVVDTGSSTYNSLASIGITTNSDGTLSVNSSTLANALSTNFSAVSSLFSSPNGGVATNLNSQMTQDLSSTGVIADNSTTLTNQENALSQQTNQLNTQMAALSASLTQQYSALNTLLSSLQTTSSYLTQAFQSLPTVQGTPNA
jgi:flagellar hook-associated protein 2